jgi:hypothetical protein
MYTSIYTHALTTTHKQEIEACTADVLRSLGEIRQQEMDTPFTMNSALQEVSICTQCSIFNEQVYTCNRDQLLVLYNSASGHCVLL